ncbi:MAG: hypothetical protein ACF788_00320, partial [Novipirellula sp. JB048]
MSDSRATPNPTLASPTRSPLRRPSLGSSASALDVSHRVVDAFADVFAQMATLQAPATPPPPRSAPAEASDPPESAAANEASSADDSTTDEAVDDETVEAAGTPLANTLDPELAAFAIAADVESTGTAV